MTRQQLLYNYAACTTFSIFSVLMLTFSVCGGMRVQSIYPVNARRGAKHIEGKVHVSPEEIASPQKLQELAKLNARRTPGSLRHWSRWKDWCSRSLDSTRYRLSQTLPHPADPEGFGELFYNLGTAADRGEMPSFADAGSRSGYALEFFCRAELLAHLLFDKYCCNPPASASSEDDEDAFHRNFLTNNELKNGPQPICRVTSLGGGPGYDYVGVLLADTFGTSGGGKTCIQGTVFDYEEGWKDLVEAMNTATNCAFRNDNKSCLKWGGTCDITKSLADSPNAACLATVPTTDLFICQYCFAENAKRLSESDFIFFADLFQEAANDTVFIFTEVTPRIWPDIVDVLLHGRQGGGGFQIEFLRAQRSRKGQHMMIQKREGATICPEVLLTCIKFRQLSELHEKKIEKGFQRQSKKVRGSKPAVDFLATTEKDAYHRAT